MRRRGALSMADRLSGNRVEPIDGICQRRKWSVVSPPRATAVPRFLSLAVRRSRNVRGSLDACVHRVRQRSRRAQRVRSQRVLAFPGTVFENKQGQLRVDAAESPLSGWRGAFGVPYDPWESICTGRSHSARAFHERPQDNLQSHCRMRVYSYPRDFQIGLGSECAEGRMNHSSASPAEPSVMDAVAARPRCSALGPRVSL